MMENNCVIERTELHSEEQINLLNEYDIESLHIEKVKVTIVKQFKKLLECPTNERGKAIKGMLLKGGMIDEDKKKEALKMKFPMSSFD